MQPVAVQTTYQPTVQPTDQPINQQLIPQTSNLHEIPIGLSCERSPHARILTLLNASYYYCLDEQQFNLNMLMLQ